MSEWPALPLEEWWETKETLHRWTQIVGKIRMTLTPLINHWWNVPLYVSARGLTTTEIPYGDRWLDMEFDFVAHALRVRTSEGAEHAAPLGPRSVADLYDEIFSILKSVRVDCRIWPTPVEIENPIPLDRDHTHKAYDRDAVERCWKILGLTHNVLTKFRSEFTGKCSPVHFFWGSFDLAVTRFSGRPAPPRPGRPYLEREAYSHEVSSAGWWPGDERLTKPAFYSYAAPEPPGYRDAPMQPKETYYYEPLLGFYLDHDVARVSDDPEATLLAFYRSTYEAAANLGKWDRAALERRAGE